jgi:YHS domain-containing protein
MPTATVFPDRCRAVAWCASLTVLTLPLVLLAPSAATDAPEKVKNIFCPVVGLPEKACERCPSGYCSLQPHATNALAFEGGKVMFCCGKCKANFAKSPEKFAANARHQLVATGQARQEKCPLCGGERGYVNSLTVGGVAVGFCSNECLARAAKAAPADRVAMLFGQQAFARGFTVVAEKK